MSRHGKHRRPSLFARIKARREAEWDRQLITVKHDRITRQVAEMRRAIGTAR